MAHFGTLRVGSRLLLLGLAPALAPTARGQQPKPEELAAQAKAILTKHCFECHGKDPTKPKKKLKIFDYAALLSDKRKLVVPGSPDTSLIVKRIENPDSPMPPDDRPPVPDSERRVLRAWIAAGAPDFTKAPAAGAPTPAVSPSEEKTSGPGELPTWKRALRWIGKFHVSIIHFPIALLLAAALGELWSAWRRGRVPSPAVRFCVLLGAAGAVAAAPLGWLHADIGGNGAGPTLRLHRWFGTAAALCAVLAALASEWDVRRGRRSLLFRVLLGAGAVLVGVAGHLGGTLVHGEDFYDW
jgi:hypothetical protein